MTDYLSMIDETYPIRNSGEQKAAFRACALAEAGKAGFSHAAQETAEGHENLVFGEPDAARVIFTAHYDTPRRSLFPNLMLVSNQLLYWLYNIGIALLITAAAFGAAFAVKALLNLSWDEMRARMIVLAVYLVTYLALFHLVLRGPANRRNRNDNTSGTACVMELMRRLGERKGVAFLLFDDEEKGKKGSKAFAKAHLPVKENTLVVNLDCVGNGDTFVFAPSKWAEDHPLFASLKNAVSQTGLNARVFPAGKAQMNSDHKSFNHGVGVCACRYKPVVGYFTDRIHTAKDTVAEPETVARLADALAAFAETV